MLSALELQPEKNGTIILLKLIPKLSHHRVRQVSVAVQGRECLWGEDEIKAQDQNSLFWGWTTHLASFLNLNKKSLLDAWAYKKVPEINKITDREELLRLLLPRKKKYEEKAKPSLKTLIKWRSESQMKWKVTIYSERNCMDWQVFSKLQGHAQQGEEWKHHP